MSRFLAGIVSLGTNPHAMCFMDMAKALISTLRALGHEAEYANPGVAPGRYILLGANNLVDDPKNPQIPADTIIFNSEQLAAVKDPAFFLQNYLQYRQLTVWDYSLANIVSLKYLGIKNAVHCPIGYHTSMSTITNPPPEEQDIDVLFYGSVAGPRREILDALDKTGLNVVRLFGTYDKDRDAIIARSKVVLNLHYYPNGVFEIFRVSHLLANKKCVITEGGGCDPNLENFAKGACIYVSRDKIVETCQRLVADTNMRQTMERLGFDMFKQIDFKESVRKALEKS